MCIRDRRTLAWGERDDPDAAPVLDKVLRGQAISEAERLCPVSYTHLRAHETVLDLVCRLLLEKKKKTKENSYTTHYRR